MKPALTQSLYVKHCVYVISMLFQGYYTIACNKLGFFYFSVNYAKHVFTSENRENWNSYISPWRYDMSPLLNVFSWPSPK